MSNNIMYCSELELGKYLGNLDIILEAFRAISNTSLTYELHTSPSGINVLAFRCPTDYTTPFLRGEFDDLVSSQVVDFISTKVNPKISINKAAVELFKNLSEDLKELEKNHTNTPLVITGCGLGGYLAIHGYIKLLMRKNQMVKRLGLFGKSCFRAFYRAVSFL